MGKREACKGGRGAFFPVCWSGGIFLACLTALVEIDVTCAQNTQCVHKLPMCAWLSDCVVVTLTLPPQQPADPHRTSQRHAQWSKPEWDETPIPAARPGGITARTGPSIFRPGPAQEQNRHGSEFRGSARPGPKYFVCPDGLPILDGPGHSG